jgi:hypothetical protein
MSKPRLGLTIGFLDGASAWFSPDAYPLFLPIVLGSTIGFGVKPGQRPVRRPGRSPLSDALHRGDWNRRRRAHAEAVAVMADRQGRHAARNRNLTRFTGGLIMSEGG